MGKGMPRPETSKARKLSLASGDDASQAQKWLPGAQRAISKYQTALGHPLEVLFEFTFPGALDPSPALGDPAVPGSRQGWGGGEGASVK